MAAEPPELETGLHDIKDMRVAYNCDPVGFADFLPEIIADGHEAMAEAAYRAALRAR
jgi:hypothetical protein